MGRFLNLRTLVITVIAVALVIAIYPSATRYLFYVLLAACPLSMLFMHGMGGHQGHRAADAPAGGLGMYVCPMHDEVRSTFAGSCPVCGMDLEEVQAGSRRRR